MRWGRSVQWRPGAAMWRIAALFMVGSALFAIGSFPLYGQVVAPTVVGTTFFVGSIFFTAAAAGQFRQAVVARRGIRAAQGPDSADNSAMLVWWAGLVQLVGTLLFNLSTGNATIANLDVAETNRLVWAPDVFGSVAFLVASALAWIAVCGFRWCRLPNDPNWWTTALNALGSVFFMLSAIAALTLPTTGEVVNVAIVNSATVAGALCFFGGAWLMLPDEASPAST